MIKFTVFGDLHYDELPNGDKQIEELIEHTKAANPKFMVSLGDLCDVIDANKERVLDKFNSLGIPIYHTIGNHETSCYFQKEGQDIAYLGRNYREENSVYPILPKAELEWLKEEFLIGKKSENILYSKFGRLCLVWISDHEF